MPPSRGLNSVRPFAEVREGIIKHSHDYDVKEHPELAEYLLDQRPPLEAQLIDLTDEIAYNTADLDDGYEAHLLTLEQTPAKRIREGGAERFLPPAKSNRSYSEAPDKLKFNETLKRVLNRFVSDLIENTPARRMRQAGIQTLDASSRHYPERLAAFSPTVEAERKQSKDFLHENLYYSPHWSGRERRTQNRIVKELFAFWMTHPTTLPHNHFQQEKAKQDSLPRVICDYIAGMTDTFIFEQYEKTPRYPLTD